MGINSRGSTLQKFFTWAFNNYVIDKKQKKPKINIFLYLRLNVDFQGYLCRSKRSFN